MWKASRASPAVTCASSSSVKVISRMGLPEYNTARKRQVVERFRESFCKLCALIVSAFSQPRPVQWNGDNEVKTVFVARLSKFPSIEATDLHADLRPVIVFQLVQEILDHATFQKF